MSKSVQSNDALWKKLSEIEEKINECLKEQEAPVQTKNQVDITPELKANKEEIVGKLEKYIHVLGTYCDNHFKLIQMKKSKLDSNMADAVACLVYLVKESGEQ